ncbi:MAG TPA: DUF4864 domain-containing protein [Chthoniobacteraceae bacterium]|nr:DUF4864 domain-containing protein [Chthoniobacteraceae bacterium]
MRFRNLILSAVLVVLICVSVITTKYILEIRRARLTASSELYKVIHTQLDAFRAEDFPAAYSQASYDMQHKFTLQQFERMIRRDYSDLADAERIEFGLVKYRDRRALIQVFVVSHDGGVQPFIYTLIYENGDWKIDGAVMLHRWPAGSEFGGMRT